MNKFIGFMGEIISINAVKRAYRTVSPYQERPPTIETAVKNKIFYERRECK